MRDGFASAMRKVKRGELPLSILVSESSVQDAYRDAGYRCRATLYTPITTVLTFISQLLHTHGSCQQAVDDLIAERVATGRKPCSADTAGYCKARSRLPEQLLWSLFRRSGYEAESTAETAWHWLGHRVRVVDGSTLQIADTAENLAEYPLQAKLTPGLHYSVVRVLVVFSLATGLVLDAAIRPYKGKLTGETAMLRTMTDTFAPGDVLLGDRYFAGYWDIAFWLSRGVHVVVRQSVSRKIDFRKGTRLGRKDHVVCWKKTPRPYWVDDAMAENTPEYIEIREMRVTIEVPGRRTRHITVATTLLDAKKYAKSDSDLLYRIRWQAELQLRSLKTHLGMERLRCKTPSMVRKEFAAHLLTYNAIRRVGAEGARRSGMRPYEISFMNTRHSILAFFPRLHRSRDPELWFDGLLHTVASVVVGNRPDRIEPYTCKTRPKEFPPPKETRTQYKMRFLAIT